MSRPEPLYVHRDPYRYVREVVSKLRMDGRHVKDDLISRSMKLIVFWNEKVSNERLLKGTKCIHNQIHTDIDTTVYGVIWVLYQ